MEYAVSGSRRFRLSEFRRRVVAGSFPSHATLAEAIREMQFVQADPIRSPARAQDLILRHRVDGYSAGELEQSFTELEAEEGYLFAYGFMTPSVWQRLRDRPNAKLTKLERDVLQSVAELGNVHSRTLNDRFGVASVKNGWGGSSRETKRVLEKLHHHGHLRVSHRENGIRVYQLPVDHDASVGNARERYLSLALTTAQVFGPTTIQFLTSELRSHNHLLPDRKDRVAAIERLIAAEELVETAVNGVPYLWTQAALASDGEQDNVRILAPFDPLVRNRERFEQLWGWSYRFEAYVPAAKRKLGYYAMPVLWRDKVIGWCNATVKDRQLGARFGYAGKRVMSKAFRRCAEHEVDALTRFLGLNAGSWKIHF